MEVGDIIPERAVRDTTNSIPEVVATFLDWIVNGTLPEAKLDKLIKAFEDLLLEAAGSSDIGSAAASALSRGLSVCGIKGKISNMGNGDSVIDLARVAVQNNGNNIKLAIDSVVQGADGGGEQLTVLLQGVFGAATQFLPGVSEASLVVGLLSKVMDSLGYSVDHAAIIVTMFTRYPDRVYHFIRRAFTIASLNGHDVTCRGTQAEIFVIIVPKLTEYFKDKAAAAARDKQARTDDEVEDDSLHDLTAALDDVARSPEISNNSSTRTWIKNLIAGHGPDALRLGAGIASAAYGGGVLSSLVQGAVFAGKVYKSHKADSAEKLKWNEEAAVMLHEISDSLVIQPDYLVDNWIMILWLCFTAMLLPSVIGAWQDVEMVANALLRHVNTTTLLQEFPVKETTGFDAVSVFSALVIFVLYITTFRLLYKNPAFFRLTSPSLLLSILFLFRFGLTWFMAFSAANNGAKVFTKEWSIPSLGPHIIMTISALSTILVDGKMKSKSPFFIFGRLLPFGIIAAYVAGFSDASLHIFAMAVGTLGNIMLSHMVKQKRGVKRKIVLWCFDDLLQVMAAVADNTITPHEKLELVTPGVFACSAINMLNEDKMLLLGVIFGVSKTFLPRVWWVVVLIGEFCIVAIAARLNQRGLEPCWVRWKILLPEHSKRIDVMEKYWRAYLQAKPQFSLKPYQADGAYGIAVCVKRPWIKHSTRYQLEFRKVSPVFANPETWKTHEAAELRSESAFLKHTAQETAAILIAGLDLGTMYEVRVSAVGELEQPPGLTLRCRTGTPSMVVVATSPTEIEVRSSASPDPAKLYYVRFKREGNWTWSYRAGLTALTSSKLVLDGQGKCVISDLTPEISYEVQVQVVSDEGKSATEWGAAQPAVIKLPSIPAPEVRDEDTPKVTMSVTSSTALTIEGLDLTAGTKCYIRCRRGTWPWFYRNGINPLTSRKLMLNSSNYCVITGLLPECVYEAQFQIEQDAKLSEWYPVSPTTLLLPSTPTDATTTPTATTTTTPPPPPPPAIPSSTTTTTSATRHTEEKALSDNIVFGEARVLFDYTAVKDHELTVKKDEIINIVENVDENWVKATHDGKSGILPKNYIDMKPLTDVAPLD